MGKQHASILLSGAENWNKWREENPSVIPNLQWAKLRGTNLQKANLQGATLQYSDLRGAKLQEASLQGAKLQYSDLQGANLQKANLQGATLQYSDLRGAKLQEANMQAANLQGAKLQGATLQEAKLRFVIGNGREIKTLLIFDRHVTYTSGEVFVDYQSRTLDAWRTITDDELLGIEKGALDEWKRFSENIIRIIEEFPATPCK